jgi:hypothetical protein
VLEREVSLHKRFKREGGDEQEKGINPALTKL